MSTRIPGDLASEKNFRLNPGPDWRTGMSRSAQESIDRGVPIPGL